MSSPEIVDVVTGEVGPATDAVGDDAALALAERRQSSQPLTAAGVQDMIEQIKLKGQLRRAVIAMTTIKQWEDYGGKPYMTGAAGYTIASALELSLSAPDFDFIDLGAGAWQCLCPLTASFGGRSYTDVGDCDSFDNSFAKRRKELETNGATGEQISIMLQLEAKKKSLANAVSRVVSGWTGLRSLSWEDLERLGLEQGKANRVVFKAGGAGGKVQSGTVEEMLGLPSGSKVAIRCTVTGGMQREGKKGPYCDIDVAGESGGTASIRMWSGRPDWCAKGAAAFFPEVTVGEYQGRPQYSASRIEQAEVTATPDKGVQSNGNRTATDNRPNPAAADTRDYSGAGPADDGTLGY